MTQGEESAQTHAASSDPGGQSASRSVSRDAPMIHAPTDPPLCETCEKRELSFFDPNCPDCSVLLSDPSTNIPQIFAILRQWTPQTQNSLQSLIAQMFSRGLHVNDRDGLTDMTLLHYASKAGANGMGDVDEACAVVNMLLDKGADVYLRCRWTHMTPLHYATYFDTAPAMSLLLNASKGIDVDSPCAEFDHGTPLHIAASNLSVEAVRILLQNKANPHAKDDLGRTPLDCVPDPESFEPGSETASLASQIGALLREAAEEAPPSGDEENYSEIQIEAALQALGLQIGDKVTIGGVKTGTLRYCGSTEFASGIWAGIELDEPEGKNDGSVAGERYFRCPPKRGIFAPLSKVCKPGSERTWMHRQLQVDHGKIDTSHVTSKVDTGLRRGPRVFGLAEGQQPLAVNDRVLVAGQRRGYIRYSGQAKFAPGWWYGIELDRPVGKNDGTVNGERYFTCKPKYGVFAPSSRVQKINSSAHGSRDSLDAAAAFLDKTRRLSGNKGGSQPNMNMATAAKLQTSALRAGAGGTGPRRPSAGPFIPPEYAEYKLHVGMAVFCNNEMGTVRYIGPVDFSDGVWLGLELRSGVGKNDGTVQGKRYFNAKHNHGLLVRPSKVSVKGINGAKLLGDPAEYLPPDGKGGGGQ